MKCSNFDFYFNFIALLVGLRFQLIMMADGLVNWLQFCHTVSLSQLMFHNRVFLYQQKHSKVLFKFQLKILRYIISKRRLHPLILKLNPYLLLTSPFTFKITSIFKSVTGILRRLHVVASKFH
jgi:hypothetical protein